MEPVIATAAAATAAGFLVLLLSPVPMVRGFGALIVVGIVIAFLVALTAGFAVLAGDLPVLTCLVFAPHPPAAARAGPVTAHTLPVRQAHRKGTRRATRPMGRFVLEIREGRNAWVDR